MDNSNNYIRIKSGLIPFVVCLLTVLLSFQCAVVNAQDWHMQPVPIQTRWAKEVSPSNALPEYPRPQLVRKNWTNLNGLWDYAITDSADKAPARFDGKILVPYPIESALSGVKITLQPSQLLWYKKEFQKPELKDGEKELLHFGAVDYQASVYLNGQLLCEHTGGYQNFSCDITDQLRGGRNELVVRVYDPTDAGTTNPHGKQMLQPAGMGYTGTSGIWQTVWLETVPETYIRKLIMTPDIDKGGLSIQVNAQNANAADSVELSAFFHGRLVNVIKGPVNQEFFLPVHQAHLWSPDHPALYDLSVCLVHNGKVMDQVGSYFGMRKIEIKKDQAGMERIFLNNYFIYNLGVLDQGFWPDGIYTAPTDAALRFDIEAEKSLGFNTIRKHAKIEPLRWYYYCDKLGMMVWQDMPAPGNDSCKATRVEFEKEMAENLEQLHNSPSIIMWVLFNEVWGIYDMPRLCAQIKELDPSRILNGHTGGDFGKLVDSAYNRRSSAGSDMTDIHAYGKLGLPTHFRGKAMVIGEFGGQRTHVKGHQWDALIAGGDDLGFNTSTRKLNIYWIDISGLPQSYREMSDQLKKLKDSGLSGSIYTQPFDVETEENGLMSYDREMIKIPVREMRASNAELIASSPVSKEFVIKAVKHITPQMQFREKMGQYKNGDRNPSVLFDLYLLAVRFQNPEANHILSDYIKAIGTNYTRGELYFIACATHRSDSPGFRFFRDNAAKIDAIMGKNYTRGMVSYIIEDEKRLASKK